MIDWLCLDTRHPSNTSTAHARNQLDKDLGTILYLSQFRRQAGKTQVYSMPTDGVRNRLTHSLEVRHIADQLFRYFLVKLEEKYKIEDKEAKLAWFILKEKSLKMLECVCIAHDIGHPPFAHSGEKTLRDLRLSLSGRFDSNLQNMRIFAKLSPLGKEYDLNPCYGVLDGLLKLKHQGFFLERSSDIWLKEEIQMIEEISEKTGTRMKWDKAEIDELVLNYNDACRRSKKIEKEEYILLRHPLTYFMTCADDICYLSSDIEDGIKKGVFNIIEVCKKLETLQIKLVNKDYEAITDKSWKGFHIDEGNYSARILRNSLIRSFLSRTFDIIKLLIDGIKEEQYPNANDFLDKLPFILASFSVTQWSPHTEFGNFLYMRKNIGDDYGYNISKYKSDFFTNKLFISQDVLNENSKAKKVVSKIYKYMAGGIRESKNPIEILRKRSSFLSEEYRIAINEIINKKIDREQIIQQVEAVIIDYIAGMTDQFAETFLKTLESSDFMNYDFAA